MHTVSLHDIDVVNSGTKAEGALMGLFSGQTGEISAQVRESVDSRIAAWLEEGKCQVVPGVLFIDEVHMLDIEAFSFLNRALEGAHSPFLIVASNRGVSRIRGTEGIMAAHGVPTDFLDRMLIIATEEYSAEQVKEILTVRAFEEDVKVGQEALNKLVQIVQQTGSLRYAMQLIMTAGCAMARRKGNNGVVEVVDVERVWRLFLDTARSAARLQ
jgi:RuvB-like protein 2